MVYLILIAYAASVYAANWAITTFGMVPVGFGLLAPAGVYAAGLSLALRDACHERAGARWAAGAVLVGAALSALFSPALALASGAAFLLSEFADLAVYTPIRKRSRPLAVLLSGSVGLVIDSALFLWLAFGSLDFLPGQVVGKLWITLAAAGIVWVWHERPRTPEEEESAIRWDYR